MYVRCLDGNTPTSFDEESPGTTIEDHVNLYLDVPKNTRPWFEYSPDKDTMYCLAVAFFFMKKSTASLHGEWPG